MKSLWTKPFKRVYAQAYRKDYYPAHKAVVIKYSKAYIKKHPKKHAKYVKQTFKNNPKKYTKQYFRDANNRAYMRSQVAKLMLAQFKELT